MMKMETVAIDPFVELVGERLREAILWCVDGGGRLSLPAHAGERMEERGITGGEILNALRSGRLVTDQWVAGSWRYLARKNDVEVCFAFDLDEDGNVLVIVTVIRKD